MPQINEAYERVLGSDVRYRFEIDMATLRSGSPTENGRDQSHFTHHIERACDVPQKKVFADRSGSSEQASRK